MSIKRKRPTGYKIESMLVSYLKKSGVFKGCAIIEKNSAAESPDDLPCIIVNCVNITRTPDMPASIYAKDANIVCMLHVDSEDTKQTIMESYAQELEWRMENLCDMQKTFNKPSSGRDRRKTRGLHLHYISEFQTDSETDGTEWQFGVGCTLMIQETQE